MIFKPSLTTKSENTCLETGFPGETVQEQKTSWTSLKISLGVSSLSSVLTVWLSRGKVCSFLLVNRKSSSAKSVYSCA